MSTNLVTGGSGYFSEVLATKLLDRGENVVIFDLNAPCIMHPKLTVVRGDVLDLQALRVAATFTQGRSGRGLGLRSGWCG